MTNNRPKKFVAVKKKYTITLFCMPQIHGWFYNYILGIIEHMQGTGTVEVEHVD